MTKTRVELLSKNGTPYFIISSDSVIGSCMGVTISQEKRGGITEISLLLLEGYVAQFFPNVIMRIVVDSSIIAIADIPDVPPMKGSDGTIEIVGYGLSKRLRSVTVQDTITATTLKAAILRLSELSLSVGIIIDSAKIAIPTSIIISNLEINSKTAFDVIELYITIANNSVGEDVFSWSVDNDSYLIINDLRSLEEETIFEGYQFNSPKITNSSSDIINSIVLYRLSNTTELSEYVDTYQDVESIAMYGLCEQKKSLNFYASDADCGALANGIIAENAYPLKTITASNVTGIQSWSKKRLMLSPFYRYQEVFNGDSIESLNTAASSNTTYELDDDAVIGANSIKCSVSQYSNGYAEAVLSEFLFNLNEVRLWLKASEITRIAVTLVSRLGEEFAFSFLIGTEWSLYRLNIQEISSQWVKAALYMGENALYFPVDSAHDYALYFIRRTIAQDLSAIRIGFEAKESHVWLDRIDCLTTQWDAAELYPSKIKTEIINGALTSTINYGSTKRTSENEMTEIWKALRGIT
jgi:hypothetical protein